MADEELGFEVTGSSDKAAKAIDELIEQFQRLDKASGKTGSQLKSLSSGLNQLAAASKNLESTNLKQFTKNMQELSKALSAVQGFKSQAGGLVRSLTSLGDAADQLSGLRGEGFSQFATDIKTLATSLEPLNNVSSRLGATLKALGEVETVAGSLGRMNLSEGGKSGFAQLAEDIQSLANAVAPLSSVKSSLGTTINALSRFNTVASELRNADFDSFSVSIQKLVTALSPLGNIAKNSLNTTVNALKKLPEISNNLAAMNFDVFANQIRQVASAMEPLASQMDRVARGFNAFPTRIQRVISNFDKYSAASKRANKESKNLGGALGLLQTRFSGVAARAGIIYNALQNVAQAVGQAITLSMDYTENLNLFTVAMGEAAQESLAFAENVSGKLGIDVSQWMRAQGTLQAITTGFGVANDAATIMSRNLTQLGYDLSSFYNIGIEEAFEKIQSGISGELEPLRRLGFALDEATLQQVAYQNGINMSIRSMTQAQKAYLRYIAIIQQSSNAQGDMARTIKLNCRFIRRRINENRAKSVKPKLIQTAC